MAAIRITVLVLVSTWVVTAMGVTPFFRDIRELPPLDETCGKVRLLMTGKDKAPAEAYYVDIRKADEHRHYSNTEFYYVLDGAGQIKLNGKLFLLSKGTAAVIPPGTWHQGIEGPDGLRAVVACVPKALVPYVGEAKTYNLDSSTDMNGLPRMFYVQNVTSQKRIENPKAATFYYVLAGSGIVSYSGKEVRQKVQMTSGRVLFLPYGTSHTLVSNTKDSLTLLTISMNSAKPTNGVMNDIHLRNGGMGGLKKAAGNATVAGRERQK